MALQFMDSSEYILCIPYHASNHDGRITYIMHFTSYSPLSLSTNYHITLYVLLATKILLTKTTTHFRMPLLLTIYIWFTFHKTLLSADVVVLFAALLFLFFLFNLLIAFYTYPNRNCFTLKRCFFLHKVNFFQICISLPNHYQPPPPPVLSKHFQRISTRLSISLAVSISLVALLRYFAKY